MVAPVAAWATRTGHRFTSSTDSLSVDVVAWTNQRATGSGGEGDVASVTFTINGTPQTPITSRSSRRPNYNTTSSPLTGTTEMSALWAFGFDLNAADWPNGTITIDAVATTTAGSTTNLPQLRVYNNKTTDTRPGSKVIYVSPTGSNSNNGLTTGAPVQSIQYACELAATSGDLGGAEIRLMAGAHSWALYFFGCDTARYTSDHWWFTIRLLDGASISRPGAITNDGVVSWSGGGADTLFLIPNTGSGHTDTVRVLMVADNPASLSLTSGDLKVWTGSSTATWLHHEGLRFGNPDHDADTKRWSVHWSTAPARLMDHIAGGGAGSGKIECTNVHAVGIDNAFMQCAWTLECRVTDWTGIQFASSTLISSAFIGNVVLERQRYNYEVAGLIDCEIDSGVTMVVVDANTLRIQQSAGSDVNPLGDFGNPTESIQLDDLSVYGTELQDSAQWGITVYNGTTPQSGLLALNVSGSGTNGTGPYVEIDWPSHGYGSDFSLAGWRLKTGNKLRDSGSGTPYSYVDAVHPDVAQFFNAATDWLIVNVRSVDITGSRIWALGPGNMTRVVMVNCGDGAVGQASSTYPGTLTDCVFLYCTFGSTYGLTPTATAGINEYRACHFESFSGTITGVDFDSNSFANAGHAVGTNTRTGTYFAGDVTADPWHLTPAALAQGGASSASVSFDPALTFADSGGAVSHGCWLDVAEGVTPEPVVVTASGPAAITVVAPTGTLVPGFQTAALPFDRISVAPAAGSMSVGALMSGSGASAGSVAAADGAFEVSAADVTMTGAGAVMGAVVAPDGTIYADALLDGDGGEEAVVASPDGSFVVLVVMPADGPEQVDVAAPDGTFSLGVALPGAGPEAVTVTAATGTMGTDGGWISSGFTAAEVVAPTAVLSVGTVDPTPTPTTNRSGATRLRDLLRYIQARRPARRWR